MDWFKTIFIAILILSFGGLLVLIAKEINWQSIWNQLCRFLGILITPTSQVLQTFCQDYNGDYHSGSFGNPGIAYVPIKNWRMKLCYDKTSSGQQVTCFEILYHNLDEFIFEVHPTSLYHEFLVTYMEKQDINVGNQLFDDNFIIKSNDEKKVQQLLGSSKIQETLSAFDKIRIQIKKYEPPTESSLSLRGLSYTCEGQIKDPFELKKLYGLFSEMMNVMLEQKIASDEEFRFEMETPKSTEVLEKNQKPRVIEKMLQGKIGIHLGKLAPKIRL